MNICNECNPCHDKCKDPCGCAEPVFSVEAMPDDPTVLRFNVNGKSVWYDFTPVVETAETATTITVDSVGRTLNHYGEKSTQTLTARELGAIFHLADLGDVDANSIDNFGIPVFLRDDTCGEGCEGVSNKWVARNPIKEGASELSHVMGTNSDGKLQTLLPPTDTTKFSVLTWAGASKAMWKTPTVVATAPVDGDGKVWRPYIDPSTLELVIVKEDA